MNKKRMYILVFILVFMLGINTVSAAGFSSNEVINVCGFEKVPKFLPKLISGLYNLVKILVPIILIIVGLVDFINALSAEDVDKMKKSQKKFITSLIAAVIIFLIMAVVQFVFRKIEFDSYESGLRNNFTKCWNCLLNNRCPAVSKNDSDLCKNRTEKCTKTNDSQGNKCEEYTLNNKTKCRPACSNFTSMSTCPQSYCNYEGQPSKGKCIAKTKVKQKTTNVTECEDITVKADCEYEGGKWDNGKCDCSNATSPSGGGGSNPTTTNNGSNSSNNESNSNSTVDCSYCNNIPDTSASKKCKESCENNSNDKCSYCDKITNTSAKIACEKGCKSTKIIGGSPDISKTDCSKYTSKYTCKRASGCTWKLTKTLKDVTAKEQCINS